MTEMSGGVTPAIVVEIIRTAMQAPPGALKRIRFAVTADEREQIRQYCFARDGRFAAAIKGIPLQVEQYPEHPVLLFEDAPQKA
jgi:hypothetical protein